MKGTNYKGFYIWPFDGYFDIHESADDCNAVSELHPTLADAKRQIDEWRKWEGMERSLERAFG